MRTRTANLPATPLISAVVVSYRSAGPRRARARKPAGRRGAAGLALETIAVVNSGDPEEARALAAAADRVVFPGRNLGFAGGLNAGLEVARGETFVLANPDVVVRAGTLAALATEARETLVAAGPALFLDEGRDAPSAARRGAAPVRARAPPARGAGCRGRLPAALPARAAGRRRGGAPGDPHRDRPLGSVRRRVAADARARRDFRRGLRPLLRGERLAASPEERGGPARHESASARVVHRYNQSARLEPRAAAWFAASERRYFGTHFAARGARALDALAAAAPARAAGARAPAPLANGVLFFDAPTAAIALSPVPDFGASRSRSPRLGRRLAAAGGRQARLRRRDVVRARRRPRPLEIVAEGTFGGDS